MKSAVLLTLVGAFAVGCEVEFSCENDGECSDGFTCRNAQCVPGCDNNVDCAQGEVCVDDTCGRPSDFGLVSCSGSNTGVCAPYDCDLVGDICLVECNDDFDCYVAADCVAGVCTPKDCSTDSPCVGSRYRCDTVAGRCGTTCSGPEDCSSSADCVDGKCI